MDLTHDTGVAEIEAPKKFVGKSLIETKIGQNLGVTIIAIRRNEGLIVSPRADEVILAGDILAAVGQTEDCLKLRG